MLLLVHHIEVQDPATVVREHDQDKQDPKCRRRNREEVNRDELADVISKKGFPSLRRWTLDGAQDARNGPFRDIDSKPQQFSMYARSAPQGICGDHVLNQVPDFPIDGRSSWLPIGRPRKLRPVLAKPVAMPTQDRIGMDNV